MKAQRVKELSGFSGEAALYRVDPPMKWINYDSDKTMSTKYVIVSAASCFGMPETYIFPASAKGIIKSWGQMAGSFKGELNHYKALSYAGYEVINETHA